MATGWVKSLHCKSNALDDVACPPTPSKKPLLPLASCGNSSHALRDVLLFPKHPSSSSPPPPPPCLPKKRKPKQKPRPAIPSASPSPGLVVAPARSHKFPTLTELPAGHSSRRVVEIIFTSSWSSASSSAGFPGAIEMLFRVHNPPRTVARFEEYRAAVRSRAARSEDPRCVADGNEMMRFHCGAGAGDGVYDGSLACRWTPPAGGTKAAAGSAGGGIRTFAGSTGAHRSGGRGGAGRRAMLVCRVIAGRVRDESDAESEADSVSREKGELVVFDPRAVLPCFLIIYKV